MQNSMTIQQVFHRYRNNFLFMSDRCENNRPLFQAPTDRKVSPTHHLNRSESLGSIPSTTACIPFPVNLNCIIYFTVADNSFTCLLSQLFTAVESAFRFAFISYRQESTFSCYH